MGGGILGLAIAYKLQILYPKSKIILFEKDKNLGSHQSGRNSGVLHCGLAYEPGSLKARLAVSGIKQMTEFCEKNQIPYDLCGKIVVASDDRQSNFLDNLAYRGKKNGLDGLKILSKHELKLREPYVKSKKTLLVPQEGIVDYNKVMSCMAKKIKENDGEIFLSTKIVKVLEKGNEIIISDNKNDWKLDLIINCTGLFSDRNYQKFTGEKRPVRIIPFRGEYMSLKHDYSHLVNHLVYPAPDPKFPFLGVHFTRLINGDREVGPNAVFAFKREGYSNSHFSFQDTVDSLSYSGFMKFVLKNFKFSVSELGSSVFKSIFINQAKKLIPEIDSSMLKKGTAGVRAQAMDKQGKLIMDFNVIRKGNQIHVLNAPSPGATASLSIADYIINNYY